MFVTCYYDIYNKPERFIEYIYQFYDLAISGLPIIVFTSTELVSKFRIFPSSVQVIGVPLETFELYNIGMKYDGELPGKRDVKKDTKEFLSIMNTKIEFIVKASASTSDDTFIWIDFGILKIIKNKEAFIEKLWKIHEGNFTKIRIPGCWNYGHSFSVDSVNWRFCGGFFIIPRTYIQSFYQHCKNVLTDFCTMPRYKLTWETNVWSIVEACAMKDDIEWYAADHNDSILRDF